MALAFRNLLLFKNWIFSSSWPVVEERIDPIYVPEVEYRPAATSTVSVAASQWGSGGDGVDDFNYVS